MAPISDKRSQQQPPTNQSASASPSPQINSASSHHGHSKDTISFSHSSVHGSHGGSHAHSHSHTTHTKENASSAKPHSKKGLEILDFHESWLEEMEIYKDQMFVQKSHKYQQQLFGSHNHVHTPQGICQLDGISSSAKNLNLLNVAIANQLNAAILNAASSSDAKRRSAAGGGSTGSGGAASSSDHPNPSKSRVTVRSAATIAAAAAATATAAATSAMNALASSVTTSFDAKQNGNVPLLLKRSRDGNTYTSGKTTVSAASNAKRPANAHLHSHSLQQSGGDQKAAKSPSPPPKSNAKVIVNQFHASSLLNSHSHHDEKTKILTQNGLTKSAASAYETSMYACNYLPQENRLSGGTTTNTARHPNAEHNNYVGVSLATKSGADHDSGGRTMRDLKDVLGQHHHTTEDDPCAAIDDVNDYTDSDSEEDYIGFPFYLEDDGVETHQSRNIRYQPDLDSLVSEDSDTEERSEYYRPKTILTPSLFPNVPPYLNFSSHAQKGPPMPTALHKVLKWKLSPVMPKIVKRVVLNSGFRIIKNTTDWMAIWEKHMKSPGFRTIRSHQKYNHMPGSFRIGRKDSMWRSIYHNVQKFGSKEFGFMQKSYVMPDDLESLRQVWPKNASKLTKWIVKPPASARGTGIRIVNKWSQFPKDRPLVVQKYIERPLLINDNKFDMRIYVIVTSINPLRIYMYKDGLARFASVKYSSELNSLDDRCMHLTNYSINKFSQNYSKNEDFNACQGHKWTLQSLWSCLESRGVNTKRLWATLRNLVIKSIISGESGLNRMYRQNVNFRYNCFELFGFDVLLDENLVPWLLEINISPSLHSELPLDLHVKGPLIQAVLNTALYQVPPKLSEKQQNDILDELKMKGPLCHDKRIFTTCLTAEEVRKHNQFTNRSIEFREEYIDSILDNLLPDDVRCLIITEDEYARSRPLERVFPTPDTHIYLKFVDSPRYYNRLLDAWEHRYGHCRELGLELLSRLCEEGYHQQVSDAALEKEPNVQITEIDMLHVKKSEDPLNIATSTAGDSNAGDSGHASKAGSPELHSSPGGVAVA